MPAKQIALSMTVGNSVEWALGISPEASHRTVRDSLPSYGSSYSKVQTPP
ncbi:MULTISPECIES: hypothetical protein [unclassified Oceanispirochaeta]|nr:MULTISPECIES: hypothetical protein [unclassified Oceanispirochaeta]MBF9018946.1 hypothetical protein [Oceanispirochaeta sp. M2]NPD75441.1 hypothetical protein [Oceanispirochaeta sp. M1]